MAQVRSEYTDSVNFFGGNDACELAAQYDTPLYVYNEDILRKCCRELRALSSHPQFYVNYSAKANSNLSLLKIIREEGLVVDAMSPGELFFNLQAGFTPDQILYVCNNVSEAEMRNAAEHGVLLSVDSLAQLEMYGRVNPGGKVMIRFNPGIGAGHHKKVVTGGKATKFGVDPFAEGSLDAVRAILTKYNLTLAGVNQHIGSLFMEAKGYIDAARVLLSVAEEFDTIEVIDFGGGFGIPYRKYEDQPRLDLADLSTQLHGLITEWSAEHNYAGRFYVEPGRYVAAECGLVLGSVYATKYNGPTRYVGTDLGFNVLARPMLYDAHHDMEVYRKDGQPDPELMPQTVVGNICESGDIMAKDRPLPKVQQGDIIGVMDAGAYGYVMSSTYNQRLRPAEILITSEGKVELVRRRETLEDLMTLYK
ncbi:MAG: diaminopimelate decarboxylase [Pseudomonadota bacterium]